MSDHPTKGVRMILRRLELSAEQVVYGGEFYGPSDLWRGKLRVAIDDGEVQWQGEGEDAPLWMLDFARAFLRSEWKGQRKPDSGGWPERITRWRKEKVIVRKF